MNKMKKAVAIMLVLFVTINQMPNVFYNVSALEEYHYNNGVVEIVTEKESNADNESTDLKTGEKITLPKHLLKVEVTVDETKVEESLDLYFNKDDPGKTIVKALEGYDVESVTLDDVAVKAELNITFKAGIEDTKVLNVLVKKKVVEEEKVGEEPVQQTEESVKPIQDSEQPIIYVSSNSPEDENATIGTKAHPYGSLDEAVEVADKMENSDITIELLSDLVATKCARINGKNITLVGNGHTITRGDNFDQIQDNARSTYNPAMIEVCNSAASQTASLYLVNITLDDAEKTVGTRYAQATTDGKGGNTDTVQDAIIATYDGVGTITLGNHTTLKGYGGMSAVRLSGGKLIMESGSLITGGKTFTTKPDDKKGEVGAAGAIWSQGGQITINQGASINGVEGRGIYLDGDGSEALVNGTISNIKGNLNMWQGESGVAIHVRDKGHAILGETGIIENITGDHAGYRGAVMTNRSRGDGYDFETKQGSVIRNVTGFPTLYSNYGTELLNGKITECSNDFIIGGFAQNTTIGETGVIENCIASNGAANAIVYTSNASKVYLKGTVSKNKCTSAFYIINQSGGGATLEMYQGAFITNNTGRGVYVNASSSKFIMNGGIISDNGSYGVYVREKSNSPATFIMKNGQIINNMSYGVYYSTNTGKTGYVNIDGGEIFGNESSQVYIDGNNSEDSMSRLQIKDGVIREGNDKLATINTSFGDISSFNEQGDLYLGNAKKVASDKLSQLVTNYKASDGDLNDYKVKGTALWLKPSENTFEFMAKRPYSINGNLPLYVAYIPLNEDGTPKDVSKAEIIPVINDTDINVKLENLVQGQSYAIGWMQPSEKFGSLAITGDTEVHEELGKHHYEINYKVTYSLSNDIKNLLESGHEFTVDIQLDKRIDYNSETGEVKLPNDSVFEIVSTTYDTQDHTIKVGLKLKDKFNSFSKAELSFKASVDLDEVVETTFESDASLSSSLKLSGDTTSTDFTLETIRTAQTKMIPLSQYNVSYTGGSERVKEGTILEVDTDGGVMNLECPEKVMEDINLPDPTKDGYVFTGWKVEKDETSIHFTALYHELYTVRFVDYDGSILAEVKVKAGKDAQAPQDPERDGYRFTGWDISFTNVQSDLTVTALYNQLFTVTFVDYDGTVLDTQVVEDGNAAIAPQNPTRTGYTFTGWDNTFTNIRSDLTVTAQYEANGAPIVTPIVPPVPGGGTPVVPAPAAPATPVAPAAAVAAAPVAPVAPAVETVEDNATPLAEDVVEDNTTPLAKAEGTWALVNLICAIVTVLFGFILLISKKKKEEDEDDEYEEEPNEKKRGTFTRVLSVITAIISVIAFILTEDMTLKMIMVDKWTIMMLVITVIQIVIFAFGRKWKDNDDKDQQAYQQA